MKGYSETLITEDIDKAELFVAEASKSAVINTACTDTVAGDKWFENYKSNLTGKTKQEIEIHPSSTSFKSGDGNHRSNHPRYKN